MMIIVIIIIIIIIIKIITISRGTYGFSADVIYTYARIKTRIL